MKRVRLVALLLLAVATPGSAGSLFSSGAKPCFVSGEAGYQISEATDADFTVRVDETAAHPSLRMQLVDDAALADFVLVDDANTAASCSELRAVQSIHVDGAAADADVTVALSRQPADLKIFVRSAVYSAADAAALFAVIWKGAGKRVVAHRD
jgi:hypothetical protein